MTDEARLPDNAFRPLEPGERYEPVVPDGSDAPEIAVRSVVQGVFWSVIFSAAATWGSPARAACSRCC